MLTKDFKKGLYVGCICLILLGCGYAAMILGTLTHELAHAKNAINPVAVQVYYNTGGLTTAEGYLPESHSWIYFDGAMVEGAVFAVFALAVAYIVRYNQKGGMNG